MNSEEAIRILKEMKSGASTRMLETKNYNYAQIRLADCEALTMAIEALKEPKRGEWREVYDHHENYAEYGCSECGGRPCYEENIRKEYMFCPYCGAGMKGETDENTIR